MSLAILNTRALIGLDAPIVRVEAHIGTGLPCFNIVGLPDTGVRESRDRVRAAICNSGFSFPAGRVTINLAPADLPKESSRFDLPIALGVLIASGQIHLAPEHQHQLPDLIIIGELSLTGALVSTPGALAIALATAKNNARSSVILPQQNAQDAAWVPNLRVLGAQTLSQVALHLSATKALTVATTRAIPTPPPPPCLSDVRGQLAARRALEIAACGGHSLLFIGPPGTGKSMLAQRLCGILPNLQGNAALEAAAIAQLNGNPIMYGIPPFRSPHHSSSATAIVGGGMRPKLGEISLAHQGILFLDELPEFHRNTLESLREPLETGKVDIARATYRVQYPAQVQLVAAMNPCYCGWLGHTKKPCSCSPDQIARYKARLSGPLLDRIDLQVEVPAQGQDWLDAPLGESSQQVQARVLATRAWQQQRQNTTNADLAPHQLETVCQITDDAKQLWKHACYQLNWSGRATHKVLRIARTIADMVAEHTIQANHIAEAIQYRRPLG